MADTLVLVLVLEVDLVPAFALVVDSRICLVVVALESGHVVDAVGAAIYKAVLAGPENIPLVQHARLDVVDRTHRNRFVDRMRHLHRILLHLRSNPSVPLDVVLGLVVSRDSHYIHGNRFAPMSAVDHTHVVVHSHVVDADVENFAVVMNLVRGKVGVTVMLVVDLVLEEVVLDYRPL